MKLNRKWLNEEFVDLSHVSDKEYVEKLTIFHRSLKQVFGIDCPRIAVFSLNAHAGDHGVIGSEETEVIIPAKFFHTICLLS